MDKLKMESLDMTKCNIEKIGALFPNVLTETKDENGKLVKAINFDKLKQELTDDIIDGSEESYDFTWVGKNQAIVEANMPIRKTLRPVVEDETAPTGADSDGNPYISTGSKNFDTTENLYIEGDNLDVLKLLQESYLNKIKMIYIDPPYNTGKDSFVYPDNYSMDKDEYEEETQYRDEDGNIQFKQNNETNPKFHSDWCSMIYQRLKLSKNLLTDDGVIFISIDDNEVENLKKICNEIFGESNFIADFIWKSKSGGANDSKHIAIDNEYIICFSKNSNNCKFLLDKDATVTTNYNLQDEDGRRYSLDRLDKQSLGYISSLDFPIFSPDGIKYVVEHKNPNSKIARWRWGKETVEERFNELVFKYPYVYTKNYEKDGAIPRSLLLEDRFGRTRTGKTDFKNLFENISVFDFPKPVNLIKYFASIISQDNDIILDFFSGSATTAHAVMQLNAEDGGNRKFIMVQLPEVTDEKSEARKANYNYITEIGKERIRRAGKKIIDEVDGHRGHIDGKNPVYPDVGFRVLKIDSTNMKDVYYSANEITQTMLVDNISNIKDDRSGLDLLYGVLLDWGLEFSAKCETLTIDGHTVYNYDDGSLVACLEDKKISETAIREIAKIQPLRVVFRDSSFINSADKINVEEIFKLNAPNTSVRVI